MNWQPRRALSCYALTFQGNILSVTCQCRILTRVRRTTTRSSVLVSTFNRISMEDKMSDKLINPFNYPSVAALNLTVELIRVGKMSSPSEAANSVITIRNILKEEKQAAMEKTDKEQ